MGIRNITTNIESYMATFCNSEYNQKYDLIIFQIYRIDTSTWLLFQAS